MNSFNSDNLLQELVNTQANKNCFDCDAQDNSQTSLNNGIFLCLKCSKIHKGYGHKISQPRSIEADEWTEHHLNYLKFGGNTAFKQYLASYKFPQDVTIEQKYRSVAAVFYRKKLKERVDTNDKAWIEEPPANEKGIQILDLLQFQEVPQIQDPREILLQKDEDDLDKIKNFFVIAYSKAGEGVKKVSKKIEDTNFKQEFNEFGVKVQSKSQQLGQSVQENYKIAAEKSKIAAEKTKIVASETFQEISEKSKVTFEKAKVATSEGFDNLKKGIGSAWSFLKEKAQPNKNKAQKPGQYSSELNDDDTLNNDERYEKQ